MESSIRRIKSIFQLTNSLFISIGIFEILLTIFIGVASNKINEFKLSDGAFLCVIAFGIIYLIIKFFQLVYQNNISNTPIDELESKYQLNLLNKGMARKTVINNSITSSLTLLNGQKCHFADIDKSNLSDSCICQQEINSSLKKLFSSLIDNLDTLTDCSKSKFTFGYYLDNLITLDTNGEMKQLVSVSLLRDDLKFINNQPESLSSSETGLKLTIQNYLKESFNNSNNFKSQLNDNNKEYAFFASPTFCICDNTSLKGLIFIISDCTEFQTDIGEILNIYNVIFSMWIDEYEKCIWSNNKN